MPLTLFPLSTLRQYHPLSQYLPHLELLIFMSQAQLFVSWYMFPQIWHFRPRWMHNIWTDYNAAQLFIKMRPRHPQRLLNMLFAAADISTPLPECRVITHPHQNTICFLHLLHCSHRIRTLHNTCYRRVGLHRIIQIRPPFALSQLILRQPVFLPDKFCPTTFLSVRVPSVCYLAGYPPQCIILVVRFRVVADDRG